MEKFTELKSDSLKVVLPKGRLYEKVAELFKDTGIDVERASERMYRLINKDFDMNVKVMKPQNIPKLIEMGSHDIGFTGFDWIEESKADVCVILDLGFDPVKIVAAVPEGTSKEQLLRRKIVVASEYENLAREYLNREGFDYVLIRTYGATEAFPPEDADMIIDNTSSGRTLREQHLTPIDTLMESSTGFIANKSALERRRDEIETLKLLFRSVLDARERVMLEMNVSNEKLTDIIKVLPCMRAPTIAPLYNNEGYAVKVAVKKGEVKELIPMLKRLGATDLLEYELKKVVA
ncbi:MAG: ATP phosphoribosyltransferase [Candidatus Thermoplasmatota archaeon]|nr:ATP phosphoribosyltransferase [Candidatus Thermoplasmatota archaeon]